MAILAGVAVIRGSRIYKMVDSTKLQTEMAQIQNLVRDYEIRKNGRLNFEVFLLDISNFSDDQLLKLEGEEVDLGKIKLYVINLEEIDVNESEYGNLKCGQSDRYLYSNITKKVYYEEELK